MKSNLVFTCIILVLLSAADAVYGQLNENIPWCKSLAYHGGGYWSVRVPVRLHNHSQKVLQGEPCYITVSEDDGTAALIGNPVAGLRVADDKGVEFLFELENPDHQRKRSGTLERGDIVVFPVEADPDSIALVFLYSGNPSAWLPPDLRDFTDDTERSERAVNQWLKVKENVFSDKDGLDTRIESAEIRRLITEKVDSSWISGLDWNYRVPICIRNFSNKNIPAGVVTLNTRHVINRIHKIFDYNTTPALYLFDPLLPDDPLDLTGDLQDHIRFMVRMAALKEKTLWLYISKRQDVKIKSKFVDLDIDTRDDPDLEAYAGEVEARQKQNWPLIAWVVDPLVKVFRQDIMPDDPEETVNVYAARNSYKAFQIAVRCLNNPEVKISMSSIKNTSGDILPDPEICRTGFVPVDFPVRYYRAPEISNYIRYSPNRAGTDGWRDWWPDPLIPVEDGSAYKMQANYTQPFWFDLHIPPDAVPGMYHGNIIIEYGTGKIFMPVHIKVWNLQLPDKRQISALYDLRTGPGKSPFGENLTDAKSWCRFLAKYNTSPGMLEEAQPEFTYINGKVHMEAKAFDDAVRFFIDELNINMLYTPGFFYSVGWYSGARPIFGLKPFTSTYIKAWKDAYSMFIDHITQKGWRKNFVLYISDEPRNAKAFDAIRRIADIAKEVAPDVPIYVSSWDYVEEIAGHISAWGIGAQGQFPSEIIRERRKHGDRFIYTTDGQQCLDTPFPATERLMPWFCFKYGAEAFEFWGSTWWTFDPWKYGWHAFIKEGDEEEIRNPVRYPNGDGYVTYPGDEIGVHGPVPSIRLVAIREGVDDYEIFHALETFADQGEMNAREILDVVRSLVILPNAGGTFSTNIMPDPEAICRTRIMAGEILDRLLNQQIDK